jgi:hypothetical protein
MRAEGEGGFMQSLTGGLEGVAAVRSGTPDRLAVLLDIEKRTSSLRLLEAVLDASATRGPPACRRAPRGPRTTRLHLPADREGAGAGQPVRAGA